MGMFIGLVISIVSLVPAFVIGGWLDRRVSTEAGGVFRLVGSFAFAALIVYLIGPDNLDALQLLMQK